MLHQNVSYGSLQILFQVTVELTSSSSSEIYRLLLSFPPGCHVRSCSVDIQPQNVVLVLDKEIESQFEWQRFEVGTDWKDMKVSWVSFPFFFFDF